MHNSQDVDSWLFFAADVSLPTNDKFSSTFAYKPLQPAAISIIKNALDNPVNTIANFFFLFLSCFRRSDEKDTQDCYTILNRDALFYFEWDESWPSDEPEQAGSSIAWVENLRSALRPYTKGSYVNVPDLDIPNWAEKYHGKNFKRFQQIKKNYDPDNFFTHEIQVIPPQKKESVKNRHFHLKS